MPNSRSQKYCGSQIRGFSSCSLWKIVHHFECHLCKEIMLLSFILFYPGFSVHVPFRRFECHHRHLSKKGPCHFCSFFFFSRPLCKFVDQIHILVKRPCAFYLVIKFFCFWSEIPMKDFLDHLWEGPRHIFSQCHREIQILSTAPWCFFFHNKTRCRLSMTPSNTLWKRKENP